MPLILDLAFEIEGDTITLEQGAGCGEVSRIEIHAIHLRLLCEEMGLLKGDRDAWGAVESLSRKLLLLKDRCEYLENWLFQHSDTAHADLSFEQTYAEATADLAREFCKDLAQSRSHSAGKWSGTDRAESHSKVTLAPGVTTPADLPNQGALPLESGA